MFNRYAYANNSPYVYTDPTGEDPDYIFMTDPSYYMSDIAPYIYGVDTSTKAGTYKVLEMMREEALMELAGGLISAGITRGLGTLSFRLGRIQTKFQSSMRPKGVGGNGAASELPNLNGLNAKQANKLLGAVLDN